MTRVARCIPFTRSGAVALVAAALTLVGCATGNARITDGWRDTAYTGAPLHNILVVAAMPDASRRRIWEDAFVAALKADGVQGTASYTLYPTDIPTAEVLQQRLGDGSFDGAILTHKLGIEERKTYVPGYSTARPVGIYYDPFWGSYRTMYERTHRPGYTETENVARFESSLSDLRDNGKMLWVGSSQAIDPGSPQAASNAISKLIVPELRKQKLL